MASSKNVMVEVPEVEGVEDTGKKTRISSADFVRAYLAEIETGTWRTLSEKTGVEKGTLNAKLMALKKKLGELKGLPELAEQHKNGDITTVQYKKVVEQIRNEIALILPPFKNRAEKNGSATNEAIDLLMARVATVVPTISATGKFVPAGTEPAKPAPAKPASKKPATLPVQAAKKRK